VLKRISGRAMARYPAQYRGQLLDVIRPLVEKRFPPAVDAYLNFPYRLKSALFRADRIDDMIEFARFEVGIKATARATSLSWGEDGVIRVGVAAELLAAGEPLRFEGTRWVMPVPLAPDVLTPERLDARAEIENDAVRVFLKDRADGADYLLPVDAHSAAVFDPQTGRAGRMVATNSDLLAQVTRAGWTASTRIVVDEELLAQAAPLVRTIGRRVFTLSARGNGQLTLKSRKLPPVPTSRAAKLAGTVLPKALNLRRVRPILRRARRIAGRARRRARDLARLVRPN
jgi:hypothetical protein